MMFHFQANVIRAGLSAARFKVVALPTRLAKGFALEIPRSRELTLDTGRQGQAFADRET